MGWIFIYFTISFFYNLVFNIVVGCLYQADSWLPLEQEIEFTHYPFFKYKIPEFNTTILPKLRVSFLKAVFFPYFLVFDLVLLSCMLFLILKEAW